MEKDSAEILSIDAKLNGFPEGLVGELAMYILGEMRRPQPRFALCCALSIVSFLSGNRYELAGWKTRLNLYQVVIGFTGAGKDAVYSLFREIIGEIDFDGTARESCTSGAAIQRSLSDNRNLYLFKDEVWEMLESAKSTSGSHQRELVSVIMSLYSKGGGTYGGKLYADSANNIEPIEYPYLSFVGATTPKRFTEALGQSQVDDGFLNRLIVHMSEDVPESRMPKGANLSNSQLVRLRALRLCGDPADPVPIIIRDDAATVFARLARVSDTNLTNPEFGSLWSRASENALRLAGVVAVGKNPREPVITQSTADWACSLIMSQLTEFTRLLEEGMAENAFDGEAKRAMGFIKKADTYTDQQFGKWLSQGWMPRGKLTKSMKLKPSELQSIINHLVAAKMVERWEVDGAECFRELE